MRGRIDESEVYLPEDQLPAFTLSVNDITDPSKVRGVRSTTGRVINTKEARRVLGSEQMARVNPTERHVLTIGEDSVQLFRSEIVATTFDRDNIEFQSIGGNASWFAWAKSTKIKDITWAAPSDGRDLLSWEVSQATIEATWTADTGLVMFPLIDYGDFFARGSSHDVQLAQLRPALRAHDVLDVAFGNIGYTIRPRGLLINEWKKYVIQGPTKKARSITDGSGSLESLIVADPPSFPGDDPIFSFTVQFIDNIASAVDIDFPAFTNINSFFPKNEDGVLYVDLTGFWIRFSPGGPPPAGGYQFRVHLWDQTDDVELAHWDRPATTSPDATPDANDWYNLDHRFDPIFVLDAHNVGLKITCLNDALLGVEVVKFNGETGVAVIFRESTEYAPGLNLYVPSIAPDWTIAQLLTKVLGGASCLAFRTDDISREVNVWFYDEYFAKPNPGIVTRDWRTRADHTTPPQRVVPEKPVSYRLRYAEDSADALLEKMERVTGEPFGSLKYDVQGGYAEEEVIEVPASPTVMVTTFNGLVIPAMHKEDVNTWQEDSYEFKPRLLIHDGVATGDWTLNGGSMSEYPKVYFSLRDEDSVKIAFGNAPAYSSGDYNDRWGLRLTHLVSDALKIKLKVRDIEVQNFEHGTPTLVHDGDAPMWGHVQELSQHRFGMNTPTLCTIMPLEPNGIVAPANARVTFPAIPTYCAGGVRIYGSGSPEADGIYCPDGTENGAPVWTKVGGTRLEDSIYFPLFEGDPLGYYLLTSGGTFEADPLNALYGTYDVPVDPGATWFVFDVFGGGGSTPAPISIPV